MAEIQSRSQVGIKKIESDTAVKAAKIQKQEEKDDGKQDLAERKLEQDGERIQLDYLARTAQTDAIKDKQKEGAPAQIMLIKESDRIFAEKMFDWIEDEKRKVRRDKTRKEKILAQTKENYIARAFYQWFVFEELPDDLKEKLGVG